MLLDDLEEKWLRFERRLETIEGSSSDTLFSYRHTWRLFKEYIDSVGIHEISTESIEDFMIWLADEGYSRSSIKRHYYALKKFLCYAGYCDNVDWKSIRPRPSEKYEYVILSEQDVKQLIDYAMSVKPVYGLMIWLGYEAAMRISELLSARAEQFHPERASFVKKPWKREDICEVPLSRDLNTHLAEYVRKTRKSPRDYLFTTKYGRPWHRSVFSKYVFRPLVEEIGLDEKYGRRIRYHDLRHSRATNLLRKGVDIYTVNKILCHRLLQTTMVYLHLARAEELRERIQESRDSI